MPTHVNNENKDIRTMRANKIYARCIALDRMELCLYFPYVSERCLITSHSHCACLQHTFFNSSFTFAQIFVTLLSVPFIFGSPDYFTTANIMYTRMVLGKLFPVKLLNGDFMREHISASEDTCVKPYFLFCLDMNYYNFVLLFVWVHIQLAHLHGIKDWTFPFLWCV